MAKPWSNDYISAMFAVFGVLIAYVHVQKTGQGQVVDVAQYEANARVLCDTFVSYLEGGVLRQRGGNKSPAFQPYDVFQAQDRWVAIAAFGPAVYQRFVQALGLDTDYYTWKECASSVETVSSEKGQSLDRISREWVGARTAIRGGRVHGEAQGSLLRRLRRQRPGRKSADWLAREDFVEYRHQTLGKKIEALGVVPKLSGTPGMVWRGAPVLGQDTEAILSRSSVAARRKLPHFGKRGSFNLEVSVKWRFC